MSISIMVSHPIYGAPEGYRRHPESERATCNECGLATNSAAIQRASDWLYERSHLLDKMDFPEIAIGVLRAADGGNR